MLKKVAYIGLMVAYIGGLMALYTNFKQPHFNYAEGVKSIILLLLALAGTWWLVKKKPF